MTKTAIVGAMALVGMTAFADSAFWTGAQDNFWTNAANWVQADGSPAVAAPGIVSNGVDDVWNATMTYDTAVFDRASARTTIDLDGLHVMRNITVTGADTPTYTFGTSSAQTLRIVSEAQSNSSNNGGRITVDASVVHAPVFAATLSAVASGTINEGFHVVNNSAQTITLGDIGRYIDAKPIGVYPANIYKDGVLPVWATTYASGNVFVQLDGSGPFVLAGNFVGLPSNRYGAFCLKNANGQATVPENHVLSNVRALSVVAKTTLNLEAGSKFVFTYGGDFTVSAGSGFTTAGEGEFVLYEDSDARQNSAVYIYNNCPWINQARLTVTNAAGNAAGAKFWYSGTGSLNQHGTITFEGPNAIPGSLAMANVNYSGPYYKTSTVGADASGGTLGYGSEIELSNLGALVYTGPGETSSRTFRILTGKDTLGGNAMMLEQAGTGPWIVTSSILQSCAEGTLILKNNTANPATFAAVLGGNTFDNAPAKLNLVKEGAGDWTLTAANVYDGTTTVSGGTLRLSGDGTIARSSELVLSGGDLEIAGGDGAAEDFSIPPLKVSSAGASTVFVTGSATVTIASLTQVSGTLNICTAGDSAKVKVQGMSGKGPSWLRFNGASAEFDEDGTIRAGSFPVTVEIPARGGVVPATAGAVGITSAGTDGPITLASAAVSIDALVQQTGTEATVDLAGGTMTTERAMVDRGDLKPLTIGATVGDGKLRAKGNALVLENLATNGATLTVNAAVDIPSSVTLTKSGPGEVRVTSPFSHTGPLTIEDGAFVVSNVTTVTANLAGNGTFVKDGDADFRMPAKDFPNFTGEILFRGGTNDFYSNGYLGLSKYHYYFAEGSTIHHGGNWYTTGKTEVRVAGSGTDGTGFIRLDTSGNARAIPYLTLMDDAAFGGSDGWLQFGGCNIGSDQSGWTVGRIDMNGHTLTKLGESGEWRMENGEVVNPGPIVLAHQPNAAKASFVTFYDGFSLGGPDAPELTMGSNTQVRMQGALAQDRSIRVNGANARITAKSGVLDAEHHAWGGVTVEGPGDSLTVMPADWNGAWKVDFNGPLSGAGTFTVAENTGSYKPGRVNLNGANGTFTGSLVANGLYATTCARYPSFIPDYGNVTVDGGPFALSLANWDEDGIAAFIDAANFVNGGCVAFDVASDEHVRMENYVAPEKSIMTTVTGGGTVQIDGLQSGVYKLGAREGGLVVSNASGIVLRDVQIDSAAAGGLAGEMRIADCSDITLEPTNGAVVRVGHATTAGEVPARLTISGSTLQSWSVINGDEAAYGSDCTDKAIVVGGAGAGILEILDGTAMTNRVIIGGDSNFARGAMYVRGGHFGSYGSTGDSGFNSGVGQGTSGYCYGYLEVSGGEYRMLGGHSIAATGQSGVMCVKGNGRVTMDRRQGNGTWVPSFNIPYNGQAVINVSGGGTVNLNPCNILTCRGGSASRLVLTSEGEGSLFSVQKMLICGYAANTVSILNAVDGGVIAYPYLGKNQVGAKCYFNFNGGTCRSLANYFLFGRQEGRTVGYASGHQIDKVTVFEKGATIEVQNASHTSYIEELSCPSGKGVVAVATGDLGTMSVVGSPIVVIEGDGWGASAYADFDSVAGRITGIHVTSPGCDYTHATAKVMYGATVLAENLEVTLADNVGGSFTKTGPGTLEVYGTNTYAGATIIKAGKLVARSDRTFPEGTDLVLEGGTVDFCERDYRFGKVSGTGGTIINGTASMGGVEWTIDCADLVAGKYESFPSFVSVLPGTTVRFVNTHLLTEGVRYQVYAFPNGAPGGLGNIEFEAPDGWHCTRSSTGVKLSVDCGLMLIVR